YARHHPFLFVIIPRPPKPTLFPYTTLFRSSTGKHLARRPWPLSMSPCPLRHAATATPHEAPCRQWSCKSSPDPRLLAAAVCPLADRKSTRLNSSHDQISYAVFCLKKKSHEK